MTTNTSARNNSTLFIGIETSKKVWRLAFSNTEKVRNVTVIATDISGLKKAIERAKRKLGMATDCKIYSCYESGRDGFWIHRMLEEMGVENVVVDSSSIEVNRKYGRVKTDRLDAENLVRMLIRYIAGERGIWKVVVVPTEEEENERAAHREYDTLVKERAMHQATIKSLLALHGIRMENLDGLEVSRLRTWKGKMLPLGISEEIEREMKRLALVEEQIRKVEMDRNTWNKCIE